MLKIAREKKLCPRKKQQNSTREKKKTCPRKKSKIVPEIFKKVPEKKFVPKYLVWFFLFNFWDCGWLMLWWFFVTLFNALVKTVLSLFLPDFVRTCGEPQLLWFLLNFLGFCSRPPMPMILRQCLTACVGVVGSVCVFSPIFRAAAEMPYREYT